MGFKLDLLANKMEFLYNEILVKDKISNLDNLKSELSHKSNLVRQQRELYRNRHKGKFTQKYLNELEIIEADFDGLFNNFNDKLMIFIIGNGNVGKSTLLNALIGTEVAETNFLPNTWKIDIYSPEKDKSMATLRYSNGKTEKLAIHKVKEIVNSEEKKSKDAKKALNEKINQELKKLKTKEEREEMKQFLIDQYAYESNLSEVQWPVEKNWILEKCLLVDTPGLNQNLYESGKLADIHNYYHKADGVLWLLDGQTIAASNSNHLYQELENVLQVVGGVRDNIIGVVNRMDLVMDNGGREAAEKVISDAHRYFGNRFSSVVGVSAYQGFVGISNKDVTKIEASGLSKLQQLIRDLFITKSDNLKTNAKVQGHNKLVDLLKKEVANYKLKIEEYEIIYNDKTEKLLSSHEVLISEIQTDVDVFFETYLKEVSNRVDIHINSLSEGQGASFIKNTMYKLDDFILRRDNYTDNKIIEIKNTIKIWNKLCRISEYKFIQNDIVDKMNLSVNVDFNLQALNRINYFKPAIEDNIFSFIGNVFGKAMFWLRKDGIKSDINRSIRQECEVMKKEFLANIGEVLSSAKDNSLEILEQSFEDILFESKMIDQIKLELDEFELIISAEKDNVKLVDLLV